jgi:hypothetical protein
MVICSSCKRSVKRIKQETVGLFLILFILPYVWLFGIDTVSIIYSVLFLVVGLYWILSKPSSGFLCKDCSQKEKSRVEPGSEDKSNY